MKKYLISIILGLLITSSALARSTGCKEGNCEMVMVSGFIQIKQLMKVNGLEQKSMDKELKLGQMDISIKANLKIASGAALEL